MVGMRHSEQVSMRWLQSAAHSPQTQNKLPLTAPPIQL